MFLATLTTFAVFETRRVVGEVKKLMWGGRCILGWWPQAGVEESTGEGPLI